MTGSPIVNGDPVDGDPVGRDSAVDLLQGLVSIRSLSGEESEASHWLVDRLETLDLERCRVDEAGNAVGELGAVDASRTVVLLGHIDTVPGEIPVRVERSAEGQRLYGRGAVDAKGALATFAIAAARLGSAWAREHDLRLIVVGAVEEESATSRGARHIRDLFGPGSEPAACVIGEPSGWQRVTLGYKGRVLIDLEAQRPLSHTAGPDPGVSTAAVDVWNTLRDYCDSFNQGRSKAFDQLLPSLRSIVSSNDGLTESVEASYGVRLPIDFDATGMLRALEERAAARVGASWESPTDETEVRFRGDAGRVVLRYRGMEPAWRSDTRSSLVTCFRAAIRTVGGAETRPGIVVKTGTSDMNVVAPAWRCPILAYGPGDSALDHTPGENVLLEDYWKAVQVLEQALRTWAQV